MLFSRNIAMMSEAFPDVGELIKTHEPFRDAFLSESVNKLYEGQGWKNARTKEGDKVTEDSIKLEITKSINLANLSVVPPQQFTGAASDGR